MIKTIHCIKAGPNSELGDFELSCIESWKRVYPDFEIKYWTDKEIIPLISDCNYIVSCYNNGRFDCVEGYARLKILYEYGGLYIGTDVFCVERLSDSYFEKAFSCWDSGFDTYWNSNDTFLYSNSNNPVIGDMIAYYKTLGEYPKVNVDNTIVEFVLRNKGLDFNNRLICRFTNQEIEENYKVYICIQFGAWDYVLNQYNYIPDVPVFFVRCGVNSKIPKNNDTYLFYAFLNEDTDLMELSDKVNAYINMEIPKGVKPALAIVVNCINGNESIFSKRLWLRLGNNENKGWDIFPVGNKLDEDELNAAFLDFISKRYTKIKFCRNIMEGNFTGKLEV